jgi:hypothetical protein
VAQKLKFISEFSSFGSKRLENCKLGRTKKKFSESVKRYIRFVDLAPFLKIKSQLVRNTKMILLPQLIPIFSYVGQFD